MKDTADPNLSLWKKGLRVVPTWVWERTELETLVLADNGLSDLSDRIGGLKKLRMLDLGHNKLAGLPDALGDLSGLTDFLYLHDNGLTLFARQRTDRVASVASAPCEAALPKPQRERIRDLP